MEDKSNDELETLYIKFIVYLRLVKSADINVNNDDIKQNKNKLKRIRDEIKRRNKTGIFNKTPRQIYMLECHKKLSELDIQTGGKRYIKRKSKRSRKTKKQSKRKQ